MAEANALIDKLKPKTPNNFPAMLEQFRSEIARALPKHLNPDRMARIALTAFRRTPKLAECDPRSVFAAVIQASQLGLEPDTLGRAYLIPYKVNKKLPSGKWESHMECQFIPGWKGLVELMNRSGQGTAWTGAVYEGDEFDFSLGDSPRVRHIPSGEYTDNKLRHVYAVGRPKGCEWPIIEVWTLDRVRVHRDRYNKVGEKHYSFENMEMYARKVVLLQVLKYMPLSPDLIATMEMSHAADAGNQGLTIEGALDGSWVPPAEEENAAAGQTLPDKIKAAAGKPPPPEEPDHTPTGVPPGDIGADESNAGPQEAAPPPSTRQRVKAPAGMILE